MTGASVQTAGQVRAAFPHITRHLYTMTWEVEGGAGLQSFSIALEPNGDIIPWGLGPDRPARVFLVLKDFSIMFVPDVYGAAVAQLTGFLSFQDTGQRRHNIGAFSTQANYGGVVNFDAVVVPEAAITSAGVDRLGNIIYEDWGIVPGAAGTFNVQIRCNVGFYVDYAIDDGPPVVNVKCGCNHD